MPAYKVGVMVIVVCDLMSAVLVRWDGGYESIVLKDYEVIVRGEATTKGGSK
jgi:hypothetical protein